MSKDYQFTPHEKRCAQIVDQLTPIIMEHSGRVTPSKFKALTLRLAELLPEEERQKTDRVRLLHAGGLIGNARGIEADASIERNGQDYAEIRVGCYENEKCIADIFVGLCESDEVRVLITHEGEGQGDHQIAVYPERNKWGAVERDNLT